MKNVCDPQNIAMTWPYVSFASVSRPCKQVRRQTTGD